MILEYLFLDINNRDTLEKYVYKYAVMSKGKVTRIIEPTKTITDFDSSNRWAVRFELNGKLDECARHLSNVNDEIINNYCPVVLINESAAYYNKLLYPVINDFERKFRKLLYLKSGMCSDIRTDKLINELHSYTFEQIYEFLFTDDDFMTQMKTAANNKGKKVSKIEFINIISSMSEKTLWDNLIGADSLSDIKEQFLTIKKYRNAVMHAHNIGYKMYNNIKSLYVQINMELDAAIESLIKYPNSTRRTIDLDAVMEKLKNVELIPLTPFPSFDIMELADTRVEFDNAMRSIYEEQAIMKEGIKNMQQALDKFSQNMGELIKPVCDVIGNYAVNMLPEQPEGTDNPDNKNSDDDKDVKDE